MFRRSPAFSFIIFSLLFTTLSVTGSLLALQLLNSQGIAADNFTHLTDYQRTVFIVAQGVAHVCMMLLPALIFAVWAAGEGWVSYLHATRRGINWKILAFSAAVWLLSLPSVNFIYWLNQLIPLPSSLRAMEEQAEEATRAMLAMPSASAAALVFFVMAILPAVGEELLFRGVLQRIFLSATRNPHVSIWVTAALFSFIHFEFAGFFPRMLIGAVLGYLAYGTGSVWAAVFAHLLNNGSQVLLAYLFPAWVSSSDKVTMDVTSWLLLPVSLVGALVLWRWSRGVAGLYNMDKDEY